MGVEREIRVGVVGLGFGLQVHVPAFHSIPGCRVVAVAGRSLERAEAAAAVVPGARGHASWRSMLDAGGLDAVSIALPPAAQPEVAIAAAERGVAVFCEKPAACDAETASAMLAAVRRHGVAHAVNFLFPEIPAWHTARQAIRHMAADRPLRHAALTWRVETYAHRHDVHDGWKRSRDAGGGALSTFVSHSAFYLEWLFGPVRSVLARLLPAADDDACVTAWLDFESGLHVSLDVATDCPFGTGHRLEVYGRDGAVVLDNPDTDYVRGFRVHVQSRVGGSAGAAESVPGTGDGRIWATARVAAGFVDRIRTGGSGGPDLGDGLRVQRILDACRESDRTRRWVELPHGDV